MQLRFSVASSRLSKRPAATSSLATESESTYVPHPQATTQHARDDVQRVQQNQSDFDIVYDVGFQQPSSSSPKCQSLVVYSSLCCMIR